jgi:hypothetical protein
MGKQYQKEKLLENLPDFINGKLQDEELRNTIRFEISSNPEFKKEFDELSNLLKSINSITFSEPPDFYFNNLLPQINEKIYSESKTYGFAKKLASFWKFALPVTAVILMVIGYKTFFNNNEYINNLKNDSQVVINNDFQNKIKNDDSAINSEDEIVSTGSDEINEGSSIITNIKKSFYSKQDDYKKSNVLNNEENNVAIDLSENAPDDDVFFSNDEEPNIEQEFERLNSDEQNKILNEIKNSKL